MLYKRIADGACHRWLRHKWWWLEEDSRISSNSGKYLGAASRSQCPTVNCCKLSLWWIRLRLLRPKRWLNYKLDRETAHLCRSTKKQKHWLGIHITHAYLTSTSLLPYCFAIEWHGNRYHGWLRQEWCNRIWTSNRHLYYDDSLKQWPIRLL